MRHFEQQIITLFSIQTQLTTLLFHSTGLTQLTSTRLHSTHLDTSQVALLWKQNMCKTAMTSLDRRHKLWRTWRRVLFGLWLFVTDTVREDWTSFISRRDVLSVEKGRLCAVMTNSCADGRWLICFFTTSCWTRWELRGDLLTQQSTCLTWFTCS